tara:strand:+ start:112 stop:378 length:267 start_codon:yes stop_codon:yes gene_type:complete
VNVNFEAMEKKLRIILERARDGVEPLEDLEQELLNLHSVSNPLPTKEEVIAEGDKQIKDWLMGNSFEERTAYRIGFRRSFEYVLRFIK